MWLKQKPYIKPLKRKIQKSWGRCSFKGKITVRRRGGSQFKAKNNIIDFNGFLWNTPGIIRSLERSKNHSAYIALVIYACGVASYIIAPKYLRPGHIIMNSDTAVVTLGSRTLLKNIPLNTKIHNIESYPGSGGKFSRSAGSWSKISEKNDKMALISFGGARNKWLNLNCAASIGIVSNLRHKSRNTKQKAGDSRRANKRPWVRGVAQNACDHPHGGGKGKKSPPSANYNFVRLLPKNRKTATNPNLKYAKKKSL